MKPVRLRFQALAPIRAPKRLQELYFSAAGTRQFQIEVSAKNGVDMFGFSFAGTPVPMRHNRGTFNGKIGRKALLEWVMIGEPGGSMNVIVSDGGKVVADRTASTILPPHAEGYDALELLP